MFTTDKKGEMQPLVDWEYMSTTVRTTLNGADYGKATIPIKDSEYMKNLLAAKVW
jgi:hypothetical protein